MHVDKSVFGVTYACIGSRTGRRKPVPATQQLDDAFVLTMSRLEVSWRRTMHGKVIKEQVLPNSSERAGSPAVLILVRPPATPASVTTLGSTAYTLTPLAL